MISLERKEYGTVLFLNIPFTEFNKGIGIADEEKIQTMDKK